MFLALINIDICLCSKLVYTVLCLNCKNYGANIPTIFTSCPVDLLFSYEHEVCSRCAHV